MAVVKVTRPKLNTGEKMYLGAIFKGFIITMKHAVASMRNKTRGAAAMERLKVFEGIPSPYDKMKRMVVPAALTVKGLKPGRPQCNLGELAKEVGWKHFDLIKRLEAQRKIASEKFYTQKKETLKRTAAAKAKATA